jgi:hypothetical protein
MAVPFRAELRHFALGVWRGVHVNCRGNETMIHTARPRMFRTSPRRVRPCVFEALERRDMFTAAPTVTGVEVASTSWSPAFTDYLQNAELGSEGYLIPTGSSAQSATLTWTNIDQIKIKFSKDVQIEVNDLSLSGVNTTAYAFSHFHYDPQTRIATWTLSAPLQKDRLRLDLDANGHDPVRDLEENALDGEWTDNISTTSGNGTAGGDFQFNVNVLPTDVNKSGSVTSDDYTYIHQLDGKTSTSTGYIADRDVDGSGVIDSSDWQAAVDCYFQTLPAGSPAGTNNDAPSSSGFATIWTDEYSEDIAYSLLSDFGDVENGASGLTYSIVANSNPTLFDTVSINQSTKALVVNAASAASGRATIVVRATDVGGLIVDMPIIVDVYYQDQPPTISHYWASLAGAGTWIIQGDVSDPDDNVSNFIVQLFGVFETRSAVDENGHFEFAWILDEGQWGLEYAVTYDPHGLESNIDFRWIGLT